MIMAEVKNSSYIVICEGNSEYAYIQKLNRFLSENGYTFILNPKIVGCGHFKDVQRRYKIEKKNNTRTPIVIWVDKDTYIRNDCGDKDNYEAKNDNLPKFMFSIMNFEDFLALHTKPNKLEKWFQVCSRQKHHITPMKEDVYLPLVQKHLFADYKKGDIPFDINMQALNALFSNNEAPFIFRCDFADFIKELMQKHTPNN